MTISPPPPMAPQPLANTLQILLLSYKALHNLAPPYLTDLQCHHTPTLLSLICYLLPPDISLDDQAPNLEQLWISLPMDIRSASTLNTFKTSVKTQLFRIGFNLLLTCNCPIHLCSSLHFASICLLNFNLFYCHIDRLVKL